MSHMEEPICMRVTQSSKAKDANCWGLPEQDLSLQHVINILWAFASLLFLRAEVLSTFVTEVRQRLSSEAFNVQQLSNLVWALCISQVAQSYQRTCRSWLAHEGWVYMWVHNLYHYLLPEAV